MELGITREGATLIATTEGRIDGTNASQFQRALEEAIDDNDRAVIMDLVNLTYISSAGLRAILLTAKSLRGRDATLAVCSLTEPVREVFQISGFDQIIPVHDSRDEAVSAVGA